MQIEHRQAHIRRIRKHLRSAPESLSSLDKDIPVLPKSDHDIGQTQNLPVDLGIFVWDHVGDPAVKVGYPSRLAFRLQADG